MNQNDISLPYTRKFIIYAICAYVFAGICLLPFYYYKLNPDGIAYLSIANKYAGGHLFEAVNGTWSPLLSWLLVPLIWMGIQPFFGVKLIALITGCFTMYGASVLIDRFVISNPIKKTALFCFIPINLYWTFSFVTPDFLTICIILWYLNVMINDRYADSVSRGIICGILGAVSYFAKAYNFYFFIAHFLFLNAVLFCFEKGNRAKVVRNCLTGFVVFGVLCSCWMYALSWKYGTFTLSTTGSYVFTFIAPNSPGQPIHYAGLMPPTDQYALSTWDDLTTHYTASWNPFESWQNVTDYASVVLRNCIRFFYEFSPTSQPFFVFLLGIMFSIIMIKTLLDCIKNLRKRILPRALFFTFITVILYPSGYVLTLLSERYIRIIYLLVFILGAVILTKYIRLLLSQRVRIILIALYMVIFAAVPFFSTLHRLNKHAVIARIARDLKTQHKLDGTFASDSDWHSSIYLSYYMNMIYYGKTLPDDIESQLKKYDIDYFFVWKQETLADPYLSKLPRIHMDQGKYEFDVVILSPPKES